MLHTRYVISLIIAAATFMYADLVYAQADTLHLYFELDVADMNKTSQHKIDQWLYNDRFVPGKNILIVGYADYLGGEQYNSKLSEARALNVQDYLVSMGINKNKVKLCIGKGEVDRAVEKTGGYAADRRVDIVLLSPAATVNKKQPVTSKPAIKMIPVKPTNAPATPTIETIKTGETMTLDKIYFFPGRHIIRRESMPELDNLFRVLDAHPGMSVRIEGHVCCVNTHDALDEDTFEEALSVNRAKFIYEYLIEKGIEQERLSYAGYGHTKPVVKVERSIEDEDKNRRVEIRVLKQ